MRQFTLFLILLSCSLFGNGTDARSHQVLVSVPPYKFFVNKIAKETVEVNSIVPPTASAHTFSPTPKQMSHLSHADLWFTIGEAFENKALPAIQSYNRRLKTIDLKKNVTLITSEHHGMAHGHHSCPGGVDLHFWLSPKEAKVQAETIAKALIQQYPEHSKEYNKNLEIFLEELDDLDKVIRELLAKSKNKFILVSHPAFGYFARDYDLKQVSIEFEGKEASSKQLTQMLQLAEKNEIKEVFILEQYQNKGAIQFAEQIKAQTVTLDPYSEKYLVNMRALALRFSGK